MELERRVRQLLLVGLVGISSFFMTGKASAQDSLLKLPPVSTYTLPLDTNDIKDWPKIMHFSLPEQEEEKNPFSDLPLLGPLSEKAKLYELYSLYRNTRDSLEKFGHRSYSLTDFGGGSLHGSFFIDTDIMKFNDNYKQPVVKAELTYFFNK